MEDIYEKIDRLVMEQPDRFRKLVDNLSENKDLLWNNPYMFTSAIGDVDPCSPDCGHLLEKALQTKDPLTIGKSVIAIAKSYAACEVRNQALGILWEKNGGCHDA